MTAYDPEAAALLDEADREIEVVRAEVTARFRRQLADANREHNEMVEAILQNADELEDGGDAPAEVLAVRYVRRLEAARSVLAEIFASMEMTATQYPQDLQKVRLDGWRERAGLGVTP